MDIVKVWILSSFLLCLCLCDASAEDAGLQDMDFNKWYCVASAADLSSFDIEGGGVRVRDLIITEGKTSGAPSIHLSATATNRSETSIVMTVSYVGLSGEQPIFAVSTSEYGGTLPTNQSRVVEQSVYAPPGTLGSARRHCVRVDAYR